MRSRLSAFINMHDRILIKTAGEISKSTLNTIKQQSEGDQNIHRYEHMPPVVRAFNEQQRARLSQNCWDTNTITIEKRVLTGLGMIGISMALSLLKK